MPQNKVIDPIVQEANAEYGEPQHIEVEAPGIWSDGFTLGMPTKIVADVKLSDGAFRFLSALTTYCRKHRSKCWPQRGTIVEEFPVFSKSSINRSRKELIERGYLGTKRTGRTTIYYLAFLSERPKVNTQKVQNRHFRKAESEPSLNEALQEKPTERSITEQNLVVPSNGHHPAPGRRLTPIDEYFNRFVVRTGERPHINGGKDGRLLGAVEKQLGREEFCRRLDLIFASRDPFIVKAGFGVGVVVSQMNKVVSGIGRDLSPGEKALLA